MTVLTPGAKLCAYLLACAGWLCSGAWLVGCVALDAPMRMGCSAALAVVLLGVAVVFIKHDMEMDLLRARGGRSLGVGADDDWEKGEA